MGDHLTRAVLANGCGTTRRDEILRLLEDCELLDAAGTPKTLPRLEGVLGPLIGVLGPDLALAPLAVIADAEPNSLHRFFAEHLDAAGRHVTMNFDRCVEKAVAGSAAGRPFHLHGEYDANELERLGVEVSRISRDLTGAQQDAIRAALRSRTLVFCGYSGRDYFDVDPFFRELASGGLDLSHLEVFWIEHHDAAGINELSPLPASAPQVLHALRAMNANVRYLVGETAVVLDQGVRSWTIAPPLTEVPVWKTIPQVAVEAERQRRAAAAVMAYMGAGDDLLELTSWRWLRDGAIREARRAAYEATGRYRRAAALAWLAPAVAGVKWPHRMRLFASLIRQRGCRRLAGHLHRRALEAYADTRSLTADARRLRGDAVIEYLQWRRETERARERLPRPFNGLQPRRNRVAGMTSAEMWTELAADDAFLAGYPHGVAQLYRLRRELSELHGLRLPAPLARRRDNAEEVYFESDAITGYTNAARNQLRAADKPAEADMRRLLRRSERVGDLPGILKAALLLRAHGCSTPVPLRALLIVGWSYPRKAGWLWLWTRRRAWRTN